MFNRSQNKAFNQLVSASESQAIREEGNGVVVFKAKKQLSDALIECGFAQDIRKDKFNCYYGHSMWWNESLQLLALTGASNEWTIATESHVLSATDLAQPV